MITHLLAAAAGFGAGYLVFVPGRFAAIVAFVKAEFTKKPAE
jgi:hypothetical protein